MREARKPAVVAREAPQLTPFSLTPLAVRDLEEIWDYIALDNLQAALRVTNQIELVTRRLARSPHIGHLREDLTDRGHRFYLVYSYLVVYRPGFRPLQIVRVLHAAGDIREILAKDADDS